MSAEGFCGESSALLLLRLPACSFESKCHAFALYHEYMHRDLF